MVNSAIYHALINHSNVLSNTIYNAVVQTFKEGQAPSLYVGPAYHQPGLSSVSSASAPSAVAGTKVTSPNSAGVPNDQSTPMRSDPMPLGGRVQLNTDLRHQQSQGLCSRMARFLLISGDMVCLRSFSSLILDYLRHLMQYKRLLYHWLLQFHRWLKYLNMLQQLLCDQCHRVFRCRRFRYLMQVHQRIRCRCNRGLLLWISLQRSSCLKPAMLI